MSANRTPAEWVTLAVSSLILAVVVGLIAIQIPGDDAPPAPFAQVVEIRPTGDSFHVVVDVSNDGAQTAANVQVTGELEVGGRTSTGDQVIDFLAGGEHVELTFVFGDDPKEGELTVETTSFTVP